MEDTVTPNAAQPQPASGTDLPKLEQDAIPVSFAQERLCFLEKLQPHSPLYNLPTVVRIKGRINVNALQRALNAMLSRHEILRTRILTHEEIPSQVIGETLRLTLKFLDLSRGADPERDATQVIFQETELPFNLSAAPLWRALLLKLFDQEHLLLITMHHIISDEWSLKIFFRELAKYYWGFAQSTPAHLPELPIQYGDYAIWQRDRLNNNRLANQLNYWTHKLHFLFPVQIDLIEELEFAVGKQHANRALVFGADWRFTLRIGAQRIVPASAANGF